MACTWFGEIPFCGCLPVPPGLALDISANHVPAIILFPVVCIPAGDASVHTTSIPSLDLIKVLLLSSQYSQERPNSLGH